MEVMTKEQYLEDNLKRITKALFDMYYRVQTLTGKSADLWTQDAFTRDENEKPEEKEKLYFGRYDDAYNLYVESCEEEHEHIYEVTVGVNFDAILRVHAKDEDDARDYIHSEFSQDGNECYISDDSQVVDDIEYSDYGSDWDIEDISDTGETWEEEE